MAVVHAYPIALRPTAATKVTVAVAASAMTLLHFAVILFIPSSDPGQPFITWLSACLTLFIWLSVLPTFYTYLRMEDDRLIVRNWRKTHTILRSEIEEIHSAQIEYGVVSINLSLHGRRSLFTIKDFGTKNPAFIDWFDGIPNAERREEIKHFERILANPAFGSNPTEREAQYGIDARRLNLLRWPLWAVGIWGLVWPLPEKLCLGILLAIPPLTVAMVMVSGGKWSVSDEKSGRISIGHLAILPCLCLGLSAYRFNNLDDIVTTLAMGAGAALVLTLMVAVAERHASWRSTIWAYFLCFAYAWGGMVHMNQAYDTVPPHIYSVDVVGKSETSDSYSLRLAAWGRHPDGMSVKVSKRLFDKLRPGDAVCIILHAGLLAWPWHTVGPCPAPPAK